jgi:ribonuclease VapC
LLITIHGHVSYTAEQQISAGEAWAIALDPLPDVEPFTAEQAKIAGDLVQLTSALGLSLGDRACLALAIVLNAAVYTTDRPWKKLKLGIPIHVIR